MSVTVQEANALVQLAQTAGTLLMPYHNRRWDGDFRTVRELLRRGWLGDVHEFESRFDRFRRELRVGAWREQPGPGAGLLFDLGPHLIDQALVLFGRPRAISATVRAEREGAQVDDHFELTLDYGDSRVRLGAGMLFDPPGPRFLISGTAGTYVKHGLDPQEAALRAGRMPGGAEWGQEPPDRSGELATTLEGLHIEARVRTLPGDYRGFYDNVCEVIEGRAAPAVTAEQGAQVVYCIHRAMESSARGGATITL